MIALARAVGFKLLTSFPHETKNLMGIRILENIAGSSMKSLGALLSV